MSLNKNKNYYKYQVILKNNAIYSTESLNKIEWYELNKTKLSKDPVFLMVFSTIGKKLDHLHPGRWTSMCMETKPSDIRLRPMCSDDFLFNSLQSKVGGEKYVIFSCFNVNNKKLYFVCSSEHFTNYCFSTASGNSFIRMNYSDLIKWSNEPNQIRIKSRNVRARGNQPVYHFWTGTDSDLNLKTLDMYLNIGQYIKNTNYAVLNRNNIANKTRIDIPQKIREKIDTTYNNICSLVKNQTCSMYDLGEKVWPRLPKHQHHIVPEEWFITQNNKDCNVINNINNIILLCEECHHNIHSSNEIKKKITLDNILSVLKKIDKYDDFIKYLEEDLMITLPILYSIYGVNYE